MAQTPREVYPHGHHPSVLRSHRWRTAENSAGYLLPLLRSTDQLLDIGVGPGTITVDFATRLPAGTVVGIDNAPTALEATRALAADRNVINLTLRPGDASALDFDADSFDVVHAHQVLQHLAEPVVALREMRRVCRPGGIVAVRDADYAAMTWYPDHPALNRWRALYRQLARAGGGEPDAGRRLRAWALAAGFRRVDASASAWCFSTEEDLAWWSGTWAERLLSSDLATQLLDAGLADPSELELLAAGWREWADRPGAWFAVLHGEILARDLQGGTTPL